MSKPKPTDISHIKSDADTKARCLDELGYKKKKHPLACRDMRPIKGPTGTKVETPIEKYKRGVKQRHEQAEKTRKSRKVKPKNPIYPKYNSRSVIS